jgi:hypothetical protein
MCFFHNAIGIRLPPKSIKRSILMVSIPIFLRTCRSCCSSSIPRDLVPTHLTCHNVFRIQCRELHFCRSDSMGYLHCSQRCIRRFSGIRIRSSQFVHSTMCLRDETRSPSLILQYAAPQKIARLKGVIKNCIHQIYEGKGSHSIHYR